jgi:hypothetical protein
MVDLRSEAQSEGPQTTEADLSSVLKTDMSDPLAQFKKTSGEERAKVSKAESDLAEAQITKQREAAQAKADFANKQAKQMTGIMDTYGKQMMTPAPKREIEAQTKEGMMGLAALLPVAGAFFGGKGLTSATGAMQAMTGLVKGYQEGNQQRIAFEQKKYDDAMKEFDRHQQQIKTAFDMAIKKAQVNQTAAQAELEIKLAALDAPLLRETVKKNGITAGAEENIKMAQNYYTHKQQYEEKMRAGAPRLPREIVVDGVKKMATPEQERALIASGTQYTVAPKDRPQSDAYGFNDIIAVAANEAAGSITNIMNLPEGSTTGEFQGQNTKGLFSAPLGTLANRLTSEDTQRYNAEIANFGRYLAQVTKGGRNVTDSDVIKNQAQFAVREGDSPLTVLTRIGQMRQSLERALEVKIASEKTPAPLKEIYKARLAEVQEAIPFTVNDVNNIRNEKDQTKTFADMVSGAGLGKDRAKIVDVATPDEAEKLPPGTKFRLPDGRSGTVE